MVEEEVGRVQDPSPVCDGNDSGSDIESIDEDVVGFVSAVLVFVFMDGDPISTDESTGAGRFGDGVVDDTPMAIFT